MVEAEPRRAPVEYLEQPCKTALNPVKGMGFRWSLNPYMGCEHRCTFCYVRAYEKRADRPSGSAYGRAIRVKTNVAEVLRRELARPAWTPDTVVVGAATDPYQPAEGRYRLTRACLQAFVDFANPAGLITRGPMIVRDLDVLTALALRADLSVTFSIPTLDDDVWRRTEPGTAHPRQRLRAVERLAGAGLRVGVGMAPILPGLSDAPEQLEAVVRAAREAGASSIWTGVLHLRDGTRQHFLETLARYWPELLPRYLADYRSGPYLPAARTAPVQRTVAEMSARFGVRGRPRPFLQPPPARPAPARPAPLQLSLLPAG
ncbi:MAG TPA: radical SAM protein [Candidatus Dormibacteraeota bacterium]|nr:radical SAM protein [Candidatus Dormibacteraeota bacterium]